MAKKGPSKAVKEATRRGYVIRRTTHKWGTFTHGKQSTCTIPYPVCSGCGLVLLKNDVSQKAAREVCEVWEDVE